MGSVARPISTAIPALRSIPLNLPWSDICLLQRDSVNGWGGLSHAVASCGRADMANGGDEASKADQGV